ncbi:hypothetical protein R1flu_016731 [Riccia fluitans]|uniref:Uncharacterized protein n=1 Tax=Riccia fluitans TaxID=41844 RepID=A0ABD1YMU0_9MARC
MSDFQFQKNLWHFVLSLENLGFTGKIVSYYLRTPDGSLFGQSVKAIMEEKELSFCLLEGSKGVNWTQFLKQFLSWVATLFVIGLAVAAIFAQGIYSPSKIQGQEVTLYEDRVTNLTTQIYKDFNTSLQTYRPTAEAGLLGTLPNATWYQLNATVNSNSKAGKNLIDPKKTQSVEVETILDALYKSLSLIQNNTVFTLGQNTVFPGANECIDPSTSNLTTVACKPPKLLPSFALTRV